MVVWYVKPSLPYFFAFCIAGLETRVTYLENQMDAAGNALDNICSTMELAVPTYWCCANSENAQMFCADSVRNPATPNSPSAAEALMLTDGGAVGQCDNSHNSLFCRPNGEF